MAIEGPVTRWVADHRRHHAYSDKEGDPHSPWRYGNDFWSLCKGLWHAHVGWLFDIEQTDQKRFAPDLLADRDVHLVNRLFPVWVVVSLALPALVGGAWAAAVGEGFWYGAATAFFWASLVRVAVLHHATWSINSICHTFGERPFTPATRARTCGRWRSSPWARTGTTCHHADPTAARHGVDRWQIDSSAELIRGFEKLGWATDVRWPKPERLAPSASHRLTAGPRDCTHDDAAGPHDGRAASRAAARRRQGGCSPSAATTAPRSRSSRSAPASRSRWCTSTSAARRGCTRSSSTARCSGCSARSPRR
jgi:stearoyl-CoA desaturase (delta-9 desaturase)